MKTLKLILLTCTMCTAALPVAAFAEADNAQAMERMDRIEHDVMLLQRQLSRGEAVPASGGDANLPAGGSAQLEVRLSAIEDQLRDLRGKTEENENRSRKLTESFEKLQHDVDFRFGELNKPAPPAPAMFLPPPPPPLA